MAGELAQRGVEPIEIDTGLDADGERLGGGNGLHEPGQVQQELHDVPGAVVPDVEDPFGITDRP